MKYFLLSAFVLLPSISLAADSPLAFKNLVVKVLDFIELLISGIFVLTFLAFLWAIVKGWVIGGGGEEGIQKGKNAVIAGIVAFVVMSSIWGIVYLFQSALFGG